MAGIGFSDLPTVETLFRPSETLLPTPAARDFRSSGTAEWQAANTHAQPLSTIAHLLPTPRAQNGEDRNQNVWERPLNQPQNLENALARVPSVERMLPTPRASDGMAGPDPLSRPERMDDVATAVKRHLTPEGKLLKTPTSQLAVNGGSQHPDKRKEGGHGPTLADELEHLLPTPRATRGGSNTETAKLLPTPTVWQQAGTAESQNRDRSHLLPIAVQGLHNADDHRLLPTPMAAQSGNTPENHLEKKPGRTVVTDLGILVENDLLATGGRLMPTPGTLDHVEKRTMHKGGNLTLQGATSGVNPRDAERLGVDESTLVGKMLPTPKASDGDKGGPNMRHGSGSHALPAIGNLLPTPTCPPPHDTDNTAGALRERRPGYGLELTTLFQAEDGAIRRDELMPTPKAGDADFGLPRTSGRPPEDSTHLATRLHYRLPEQDDAPGVEWGEYEGAIRVWEAVTGRAAPAPTEPTGRNGGHRLSPRFVEWMMGLTEGHVTGVAERRNVHLKALGNGVVPLQGYVGLRVLLGRVLFQP